MKKLISAILVFIVIMGTMVPTSAEPVDLDPENIHVTETSSTITFKWINPTSDFDHVNEYRDGVLIDTTVGETFIDTGLSPGESHMYKLTVVGDKGIESPGVYKSVSTTPLATIPVEQLPITIKQILSVGTIKQTSVPLLTDTNVISADSSVVVTWKNNSSKIYDIYRNGTKVNTSPVVSGNYIDTTVHNGDFYQYTVVEYNTGNISAVSETLPAIPQILPNKIDTGAAINASGAQVTVAWKTVSGIPHNVYRDYNKLNSKLLQTSPFADTSLSVGAKAGYLVTEMLPTGIELAMLPVTTVSLLQHSETSCSEQYSITTGNETTAATMPTCNSAAKVDLLNLPLNNPVVQVNNALGTFKFPSYLLSDRSGLVTIGLEEGAAPLSLADSYAQISKVVQPVLVTHTGDSPAVKGGNIAITVDPSRVSQTNLSALNVYKISAKGSPQITDSRTVGWTKNLVDITTGSNYVVLRNDALFNDVDKSWAAEDINFLHRKEMISGTGNSNFQPRHLITRAELTAMVDRAISYELGNTEQRLFSDVEPTDWYYGFVSEGYNYGIIVGTSATTFEPTRNITRQEAAVILARAYKVIEGKAPEFSNTQEIATLRRYPDAKNCSDWAKRSIAQLTNLGLLTGYDDGLLHPKEEITREQAAHIISQLLKATNHV